VLPRKPSPDAPLRADARRNREKILDVALAAFAAEGLAVPVDEIARRAGVGPGTIHRHFPTKHALFTAIVARRIEQVVELARSLHRQEDVGAAFFALFDGIVAVAEQDRGLADALAASGFDREAALAPVEADLRAAIQSVLAPAQRAGAVRCDVDAADIQALVVGCLAMRRSAGDRDPQRLLEVVRAGLRARASHGPGDGRGEDPAASQVLAAKT
jgi:AcrR family transcriptional regulator